VILRGLLRGLLRLFCDSSLHICDSGDEKYKKSGDKLNKDIKNPEIGVWEILMKGLKMVRWLSKRVLGVEMMEFWRIKEGRLRMINFRI